MSKWCFNYETGDYEDIDRDGYSYTSGEYTFNWDDSEYRREEEEEEQEWTVQYSIRQVQKS